MIQAADFDDLVYSCSKMLQSEQADIIGSIAETIHADANYAAMTAMAFYKAAEELSIEETEIDAMIELAENNCSPIRVDDFRRLFNQFQVFDQAIHKIHLSNDNFFMQPSYTLH